MTYLDIYESIRVLLDFLSQLSLMCTCRLLKNNLPVIKLCNIDSKYLVKLDENILKYFHCAKHGLRFEDRNGWTKVLKVKNNSDLIILLI